MHLIVTSIWMQSRASQLSELADASVASPVGASTASPSAAHSCQLSPELSPGPWQWLSPLRVLCDVDHWGSALLGKCRNVGRPILLGVVPVLSVTQGPHGLPQMTQLLANGRLRKGKGCGENRDQVLIPTRPEAGPQEQGCSAPCLPRLKVRNPPEWF